MYSLNNIFYNNTINYIKLNYNDQFVEDFQFQFKIAEKNIIDRLISFIIKEQLLEIIEINGNKFEIGLINESYDGFINFNLKNDNDNIIKIKKSNISNKTLNLIINIKYINKLNRLELNDYPYLISNKNGIKKQILCPIKLIDIVKKYGQYNNEYVENFKNEIKSSTNNLALSFLFTNKRFNHYKEESIKNNCKDTLEYVNYKINSKQKEFFDTNIFYEQLISTGHFFYPFTKTKIGFEIDEVLNYSSEFANSFGMKVIAIHKTISICSGKDKLYLNEELFEIYKLINLKENCENYFNRNNLKLDDYQISLIHPHQFNFVIDQLYKDEIESKLIIKLIFNNKQIFQFTPGLSTRTLFPYNNGINDRLSPCVKSSLSVLINLGHRDIEKNVAIECIIKSNFFEKFEKIEMEYCKDSIFLKEIFSICVNLPNDQKSKSMNTIFRENPNKYLLDNHHLFVSASLFAKSIITSDKTVCFEIINKYHNYLLNNHVNTTIQKSLFKWFNKYVSTISSICFKLFFKYGLVLEAHLQNTLWLINSETGEINKILFRDFEDIRISKERFVNNFKDDELNNYFKSQSLVDNRKRLIHFIIVNHFGELILNVSRDFNIDENELWNEIRINLKNTIDKIIGEENEKDIIKEMLVDKQFILNTHIGWGPAVHKSRLTNYLQWGNPIIYYFNNPLKD
ncbi:hypothetical protein ACTFIV_000249 [Dictyostelium citrinum]